MIFSGPKLIFCQNLGSSLKLIWLLILKAIWVMDWGNMALAWLG